MAEANRRQSSNPMFETSVDIPSTSTGEVQYGTTNSVFASFSATSFVSPTILTALIIASWYLSNIGVVLLNKYLLSFYGYKYLIFLTMLHMISCTFYSLIRFSSIIARDHVRVSKGAMRSNDQKVGIWAFDSKETENKDLTISLSDLENTGITSIYWWEN
ncbi:hypothetical protein L1887_16794 [Cichorium endivia]|nr:hypothetical protein L1887_16794 [Cichorium endivia]